MSVWLREKGIRAHSGRARCHPDQQQTAALCRVNKSRNKATAVKRLQGKTMKKVCDEGCG